MSDSEGGYFAPGLVGLGTSPLRLLHLYMPTTRTHVVRALPGSMAYQNREVVEAGARLRHHDDRVCAATVGLR